jgi:hypothetical protein
LLLKKTLAVVLGEVAGAGFAGRAVGAGVGVWVEVAVGCGCRMPPGPDVTERTVVVTASIALVTADCTVDLTTAMVVGFATGASVLAVVTQPPAGLCGSLQLENVVVDFTWQQPQSCGFAL